jgi:hypothetical protein
MQTMIHEMRHAYQHRATENQRNAVVSQKTIDSWADNFANYKSMKNGYSFEEYLSQSVEWDAKNFAKQLTDIVGIQPMYAGSWAAL